MYIYVIFLCKFSIILFYDEYGIDRLSIDKCNDIEQEVLIFTEIENFELI